MIALYAALAWILAFAFALLAGSWHGEATTTGLFVAVLAVGLAFPLLPFALAYALRTPRHARSKPQRSQQNQWLAQLCHSISTPAVTILGQGIGHTNAAFLQLLQFPGSDEEFVGRPLSSVIHTVDHARFTALLNELRRSEAVDAEGVFRLVRADGSLIKTHLNLSHQRVHDCVLVQFSEEPATDRSADPSDEFGSIELDQLDQALFKTDLGGRIQYLNRAWERISSRTVADCHGKELWLMIHPSDRAATESALRSLASGQVERTVSEARLITANGSAIWVVLRARLCTLPDGDLIAIVGSMTELTRRKRAEEEDLGVRHRYLNTLLANVPGMVYRGRNAPDWTMELVSDGCLALTGYEAYELVDNRRVAYGSLIHPDDRGFVWEQVQWQLARHKPYQIAYRLTDASGRLRWVWEQGRGVFSSHGELLAVEGFVTDIGDHRYPDAAGRGTWFGAHTGVLERGAFDALLAWVLQHWQLTGCPCALLWIQLGDPLVADENEDEEELGEVLAEQAWRCRSVCGPQAAVTYLGRKRFAAVLTNFPHVNVMRGGAEARELIPALSKIAGTLITALAVPAKADDQQRTVEVSVGIALANTRYADANAMLEAARRAAEQAAQQGWHNCEFADI